MAILRQSKGTQIGNEHLSPDEISEIILSSAYQTITTFLVEILKESRRKNITSLELLSLQAKIAERIISIEKNIGYFKSSANREKRNNEWFAREVYKAHRRAIKGVMDGLALRFLKFNRPVLRQLAEHNQTGHLTQGFLEEAKKAEYIVRKTGFFVILNDLTNFLRYGDLMIISPQGNLIDEVKIKGVSKGVQKKQLDNLIDMLNKKVFKAGNQVAEFIDIPGKPSNFLAEVGTLIKRTKQKKEGISAQRISPYLWVSCLYIPNISAYSKISGKPPQFRPQPFPISEISAPWNSLMLFDDFSPNIPPYSVFPFEEEIIAEIITGKIQLKVVLSERELIKSFKGKGWTLELPSRKKLVKVYDTNDRRKIKEAIRSPEYHALLSKGEFNYKIPREVLLRIETEFYSVKAIIAQAEAIMRVTADRRQRTIVTNFSQEYLVWR